MTAPPPQPRRYVLPRRRGWRSSGGIAAVAAGILLTAAIVLVTRAGGARLASPGPLSRHHAAADATCASCHLVRAGVEDLRCLRCHADGGSDRLTLPNHAAAASRLRTTRAVETAVTACASCHDDHRGGQFDMTAASDDRCTRCHTGVSMAAHPEFAVLSSGPATGAGMALSHKRHMEEVRKTGKSCDACHQRGDRDPGFAPLSFDRHCASCHVKDGRIDGDSDPVDPALLLPLPAGASSPVLIPAERGRVQVRAAHRDPWVLMNLQRWRRMLAPDGDAIDRLTATALLADIDRQLLTETAADATGAIDALTAAARTGVQVPRIDPRPRLLSLLDAIDARGDPALSAAAARLRARAATVAPPQGGPGNDPSARAAMIEGDLRRLAAIPDAAVPGSEASIRVLLDAVPGAQRVAAGRHLLGILDAIEAREPGLTDRVAALRGRVQQAMTGPGAAAAQAHAAAEQAAARARGAIDAELRDTVPVPARAEPAPVVAEDVRWLEQARTRLAGLLAAADRAASLPALPASATVEDVRRAAAALTRACAKCHDTAGSRIAPVTAARPVLSSAVFNHASHVSRRQCTDCHRSAAASVLASDVNLPGIATCRSCHNGREAPATCRTCHRYHQPASAPLRAASWTIGAAF